MIVPPAKAVSVVKGDIVVSRMGIVVDAPVSAVLWEGFVALYWLLLERNFQGITE